MIACEVINWNKKNGNWIKKQNMKHKIKELVEKYNVTYRELYKICGLSPSSLFYILEQSKSLKIREDSYRKIFEGLYLIAKQRIIDGYSLDHELDTLDSKLHYEFLLKNDKNNL